MRIPNKEEHNLCGITGSCYTADFLLTYELC